MTKQFLIFCENFSTLYTDTIHQCVGITGIKLVPIGTITSYTLYLSDSLLTSLELQLVYSLVYRFPVDCPPYGPVSSYRPAEPSRDISHTPA